MILKGTQVRSECADLFPMKLRDFARIAVKAFWASYYLIWVAVNFHKLQSMPAIWRLSHGLLMFQCTLIAFFFIFRNPARETSWKIRDVVFAITGTFATFFLIPVNQGHPHSLGVYLQILGTVMAIASFLSLKRSVGFLPANRGIRQSGMYRWVRHPVYLSYQLFHAGYVVNQLSLHNVVIAVVSLLGEVLRIYAEERLLMNDPDYRIYASKVRWRLIPYLF